MDPDSAWKGEEQRQCPAIGEVSAREQRSGEDVGKRAKERVREACAENEGNCIGDTVDIEFEVKGKKMLYLFECTLGIKQVVDHVSRHTDE